jgi:hypothetical protein
MKTASLASHLETIPGIKVRTDVPLGRLTTFKIGGPAAVVVTPETTEGLQAAMRVLADAEVDVLCSCSATARTCWCPTRATTAS